MDPEAHVEPGYIEQVAVNVVAQVSEAAEHAAKAWGHVENQKYHEDAATQAFAHGDFPATDAHVHEAVLSMTASEHEWTEAGRALGLDVDQAHTAPVPEAADVQAEHEASVDVDGEY